MCDAAVRGDRGSRHPASSSSEEALQQGQTPVDLQGQVQKGLKNAALILHADALQLRARPAPKERVDPAGALHLCRRLGVAAGNVGLVHVVEEATQVLVRILLPANLEPARRFDVRNKA